jgi:hypothetical protein
MKSCSICSHAQRAQIDACLVSNGSLRDIAGQFAVSRSALDRHKKHVPKALTLAKEAEEIAEAETLLSQIQKLTRRAYGILDRAEKSKPGVALAAIREARSCLELLGKLSGELRTGTRIGIGINGRPADPEEQLRHLLDQIMAEDDKPKMIEGGRWAS